MFLEKLRGVNHGRMLGLAEDDMIAPAPAGKGRSFDRQIGRFRAIGGENDLFGGFGMDQRSDLGAGGGFVLVKDPAQVSILEIIEAIEGKIVFQRCKQLKPDCEHAGGCALCGLYEQAQDGVKEVLLRTTLGDLIRRQETMQLTRSQKRHAN